MQKVLFICSQNRLRSPTAEQVFSQYPGIECSSAGLSHGAQNPLTGELLEWADVVFVMERIHRSKLSSHFKKYLHNQRVVCLDIADNHAFMAPELVRLLEMRVKPHL
jgi:predicted protein tyrosine phosphatase